MSFRDEPDSLRITFFAGFAMALLLVVAVRGCDPPRWGDHDAVRFRSVRDMAIEHGCAETRFDSHGVPRAFWKDNGEIVKP